MPSPVAQQLEYLASNQDRARSVTLTRETAGSFDPLEDSEGSVNTSTCTPSAFVHDYSENLIAAGVVKIGDRKFNLVNDDALTFTPEQNDIITDGGDDYRIREVNRRGSGENAWCYVCHGEKL